MATFEGHKNWTHWNVSLHLNNDEGLYLMAREILLRDTPLEAAVAQLRAALPAKTPDGAVYSAPALREYIKDERAEYQIWKAGQRISPDDASKAVR